MADPVLLQDLQGGVMTWTMNRPERMNALNWQLLDALAQACRDANANDDVRVVILTGAGAGWCSGADLGPGSGDGAPESNRVLRTTPLARFGQLAVTLRELRRPLIAAVNGVAAGAGFAICLAADIRIASDAARFSAIFVKRGLVPDTGASFYLPRLVGMGHALEMFFTGDVISAAEADRIGLVNRVVPAASLMDEARSLAERIAAGPPLAVELAKRVAWKGIAVNDVETQVSYETWAQSICSASQDVREGRTAFLEKRQAVFTGR